MDRDHGSRYTAGNTAGTTQVALLALPESCTALGRVCMCFSRGGESLWRWAVKLKARAEQSAGEHLGSGPHVHTAC